MVAVPRAPPYKPRLCGEVPERSIGAVSKTVVPLWGTEGSNPSLSAKPPHGSVTNQPETREQPKRVFAGISF